MTDQSGVEPNPQPVAPQGASLPASYEAQGQARAAGYSWDEINAKMGQAKQAAKDAGYSDAEVNGFLGQWEGAGGPPQATAPLTPSTGPDVPGAIRSFAQTYLTPSSSDPSAPPPPPIKTAGDFFKAMGHDIVDVGKIFGAPVVNGVAAIMEGLDGRARTEDDMVRLGAESEGFLGLLAGGRAMPRAGVPEAAGFAKLQNVLPTREAVVDGATALAKTTGMDFTSAAKALGENFVKTGEDPVQAAARAQGDAGVADKFKQIVQLQMDRTASNAGERAAGSPASTFQDIEARSHGGLELEKAPDQQMLDSLRAADHIEAGTEPTPMSGVFADESGAIPLKLPQMNIDPQSIGVPNPEIADGIITDLKRMFAPSSLAQQASGVIREGLASTSAGMARSADNLRRFGRAVGELSSPERADYLHAIETTSEQIRVLGTDPLDQWKGTPLGALAKQLRSELDSRWDKMDTLGIAPNYVEDYLPHVWQDPNGMRHFMAGRKPLEGNKQFTRDRVFSTIQEGQAAGFKLVTDNPIELTLTQMSHMDRFINARQIFDDLGQRGLTTFVKHGDRIMPTMSKINDPIATTPKGSYYAPNEVATLLNNYLSQGLSGRPIYDTLRSAGNMLNSAQLGMSAFHAGFVMMDAITSGVAKGVKQISRATPEEAAQGLKSIAVAPTAPVRNYLAGRQIIRQLLGRENYGPEVQSVADALIAGGGRIGLDPEYRGSAAGSFWHAMEGSVVPSSGRATLGQEIGAMIRDAPPIKVHGYTVAPPIIRAAAQIVPRVMDTIMSPIMEHMVPHMKAGVFADMMRDEMRVNPNMGPDELRSSAGRIWNSVDNRLGQLVYDNLFWDKTMKDVGHIAVRSLGWNLGTIREVAGGMIDMGGGRKISVGDYSQVSDRASYVVALPITAAMAGAVYGVLHGSWNGNWGIKDYMFPPTGGTDAQGGKERISMPGYLKDVIEWGQHPLQTAENKIHPLWPLVYDMMTNRQWNGAAITDPRKPFLQNATDYAHFIYKQFEPISFKQNNSGPGSEIGPVENALGIKPAPYGIREPALEEKYANKDNKEAVRKKTKLDNKGQ